MDKDWDVSPTAAPRPSGQPIVAQEAWLPPAAVSTEVADSPTAAAVAWTQAGAGNGLSVAQSARGGISGGCC